jgi:hypothetical protein
MFYPGTDKRRFTKAGGGRDQRQRRLKHLIKLFNQA